MTMVFQRFLGVAASALFVAGLSSSVFAVGWYDNFDDGDFADGTPVTWSLTTPGTYDAKSGDFVMSNPGDSDNDILLPVVDVTLTESHIRTQAAVIKGPGGESGGTMGIVGRWDPESFSGYAAILSNAGHLELLRLDGGAITTLNEQRDLPVDTSRDALIEFDAVGDLLSVYLWRPGDAKPSEPVLQANDDIYESGRAGIVYNENDDNTLGVFRFATAQETPLADIVWGDLNGDSAVDALDAGLMFADWGTGKQPSDINADGVTDAADAGIMFANWTGDSSVAAVPEPTGGFSIAWLMLSGIAMKWRTRK